MEYSFKKLQITKLYVWNFITLYLNYTLKKKKKKKKASTQAAPTQELKHVCHPHPRRAGLKESGRNGYKLTQVS